MIQSCCTTPAAAPGDLAELFLFGLLMSAGHCAGMCGPLVGALSIPARRAGEPSTAALRDATAYHAGRIASYATLGAALGLVGTLLPAGVSPIPWQAALSLVAAAALCFAALALFEVFPLASLPFAARVSRALSTRLLRAKRGLAVRFGLGAANGLLPCGPVYAAAVAAFAAASPARGALAMAVYGLGTVPLLVALAFGVRALTPRLRLSFQRVGAALALAMSCQLALRGLAALELVPHARLGEVVRW